MWVIGNGAPKSGSTWVIQLLKSTKQFEPVPERFQQKNWTNSSVSDRCLRDAIGELAPSSDRFLSKQHWARCNSNVLKAPGARIINIIRDARDVVVSRYHHEVRLKKISMNLSDFVFKHGKSVVRDVCKYHKYWAKAGHSARDAYFVTSYEYLTYELVPAARQIYDFVGLDMDGETVELDASKTLFSNKKQTGPGMFFRKGQAFGFQDELSEREQEFLLNACQRNSLCGIKRDIAALNPDLEKYLMKTDVGL